MIKIYSFILILLLVIGCGEKTEDTPSAANDIPDFHLMDSSAEPVRLSDYKDQVVLLVFWATWCPHCRNEIPRLKEIHDAYSGRNFKLLTVSVDNNEENLASFVQENALPYTVLFDQGTDVAKSYGVVGIPAHYIVDTAGDGYFFGTNLDAALVKADELLAE